MVNDITTLDSNRITVTLPQISFPEYRILIDQAYQVARYIYTIELNEDNIKEVKEVLANVNKSIKKLNDKRIEIKKEILEPYEDFNNQIKDIENIVKEADTRLRNEVRELEEKQKKEKKEEIKQIWNKRIGAYDYAKLLSFDDFLENRHLNKTISLTKVESQIVDFLEKSENDLKILSNQDNRNEAIELYKESKDLGIVLSTLRQKEEQAQLNKTILDNIEDALKQDIFMFKITGKKDKNFVEMLLKENEIEFEVIEK